MPAQRKCFYGPMDCGKSTLALQIDHNDSRQGRCGLILTQADRSSAGRITTRVGMSRTAVDVAPGTERGLLANARVRGDKVLTEGQQVLIADPAPSTTDPHAGAAELRYQVLCRRHSRDRYLAPGRFGPEQRRLT